MTKKLRLTSTFRVSLFVKKAGGTIRKALLSLKDWTGFFAYTDSKGERHRGKTLWDILGLLIVPIVLAGGGILFSNAQQIRTQEIERDRAREESLHTYLIEMQDLLLNSDLFSTKDDPKSPLLIVAQVKTVTALRFLDRERQDRVFQFLLDSSLGDFLLLGASLQNVNLSNCNLIGINLSGANLSGADLTGAYFDGDDLSGAQLTGANLTGAHLSYTKLRGTVLLNAYLIKTDLIMADLLGARLDMSNLSQANLTGADLSYASLDQANLSEASLTDAKLIEANLIEANLSNANLNAADLSGAMLNAADLSGALLFDTVLYGTDMQNAKVTDVQLSKAKPLEKTITPDGTNLK